MNKIIFSMLILYSFSTEGADTLSIHQALKLRNIQLEAKANGGLGEEAIKLIITNRLRKVQHIKFEPGMYFASEDQGVQDLLIFEDQVISLSANQSKELDFYGACTQLSNLSPGKGEAYQLSESSDPLLVEIANVIARHDFYNATAQAAVWVVTDNYSTANLHNGDDVDISWDLATLIAKHKSMELPEKEAFFADPRPFRRIVYSARKDLVYHAPLPFKGTLGLYDQNGDLVREYFKDKSYESGLHFYSVGINNIVAENTQYTARLSDETGATIVEHTLDPNEGYTAAKEEILSVNFEYAVRKRDNYDMVVYDDHGKLIEYIYKERPLTPAYRPARFRFIHAQPEAEYFVVKIVDSEGNEVKSQRVINR